MNVEKCRKLFTKSQENNIINKKYSLLSKFYEREGLFMRETKDIVDIVESLNFVERVLFEKKFIEVYKEGIKKGFNWSNTTVH